MRDTSGRTTVTLAIEGEGESDVMRAFDIEEIVRGDNAWTLIDSEGVPRLMLTPSEFAEVGEALNGGHQ